MTNDAMVGRNPSDMCIWSCENAEIASDLTDAARRSWPLKTRQRSIHAICCSLWCSPATGGSDVSFSI
jgi:hypothetical protein